MRGARNSRQDPFAGVATSLIRQGIPAVVAMQFEITDEAAITFASEFYAAVADGYPVDAAVSEARKAIYAHPNDVEWGTPVLYSRAPDGVLFNLQRDPQRPASADVPVEVRPPAPAPRPAPAPAFAPPPVVPPIVPWLNPCRARRCRFKRPHRPLRPRTNRPSQRWISPEISRSRCSKWGCWARGTRYSCRPMPPPSAETDAWAAAQEFGCTQEVPGSWKFERGSRLKDFYSYNVAKRYLQMTVRIVSQLPARWTFSAGPTPAASCSPGRIGIS
jgi:hypothetical protein